MRRIIRKGPRQRCSRRSIVVSRCGMLCGPRPPPLLSVSARAKTTRSRSHPRLRFVPSRCDDSPAPASSPSRGRPQWYRPSPCRGRSTPIALRSARSRCWRALGCGRDRSGRIGVEYCFVCGVLVFWVS